MLVTQHKVFILPEKKKYSLVQIYTKSGIEALHQQIVIYRFAQIIES